MEIHTRALRLLAARGREDLVILLREFGFAIANSLTLGHVGSLEECGRMDVLTIAIWMATPEVRSVECILKIYAASLI